MKYFILFLFPAVAMAADAAPIDTDFILQMLQNAMVMGAKLPGIIGAIFVGVIALSIAVLLIAKYFMDRGAREKAAYAEDLRIRTIQSENLARMQKDATTALISNMDLSYKQDYDYFVAKIKESRFDAVYAKIATQFHAQIAQFIYENGIPTEERAAHIIMLIKPK